MVYVEHQIGPDDWGTIAYVHLSNVQVVKDQSIQRGTVLGETWKSWDHRWKRHVHIDYISGSPEESDPTPFIVGCSATKVEQLTFPFRCR